ncbi:MAG TPA: hypothetical protein VGU20_29725 [Stellaceae bacterium]|nr:hypothetical protein [Stellaceae bacterium]
MTALALALGAMPALSAAPDAPPSAAPATPLPPPPAGGLVVSADGRVVISPSLCADLASTPAVPGAEYKPGVDATGQPVTPADLPATAPPLGPVEVGVDLKRRFGIGADSHLLQHRPSVAVVTVLAGVTYLNGVPLAENERAAMIAACEAARR